MFTKELWKKNTLGIVIMSRKRARNKQSMQLVLHYNYVNAQHCKLYELERGHSKVSKQGEKPLGGM